MFILYILWTICLFLFTNFNLQSNNYNKDMFDPSNISPHSQGGSKSHSSTQKRVGKELGWESWLSDEEPNLAKYHCKKS